MPRLFTPEKDINFFADIAKEIIKDVIGQFILYYPISELKTKVHTVYNESPEKIFDDPIRIDVLAASPENEGAYGRFSFDESFKIEVFVQPRDLIDRGIQMSEGDFFQYGDNFYEISTISFIKSIHGQVEHKDGLKIVATKSRESQFKERLLGPTDYSNGPEGVQKEFVQQRGLPETKEGPTGDKRELQERGVLERPLTGARETGPAGDRSGAGSSFYGED